MLPLSNVDLVHFVWENFIRFSYKKYALVLSPRGSNAQPELLFLKHYRVDSGGWKDKARCDSCVESHQVMLLPFTRATGLTTARVRSVRGSLRPWPLVPSTSSSITRCICTGFDSMSKRHTIDTCTRPVRIVCREKNCSRQRPPRLSSRSITTWIPLPISPRLYGCRVLDRPI